MALERIKPADDGDLDVPQNVQLELFDPPKVARPEYNIGKNANLIFASPYARDLYEEKHETRIITHADGSEVQGSLSIVPLKDRKRPTTTTLRIYLGLIQLWENAGRPETGVLEFSTRQLAHVMGFKWQGRHTSQKISEHLEILEYTKIEFAFTFVKPGGEYERYTDPIKIIASGRYVTQGRRLQGDAFLQLHRYTLHPELVANMLAGHVRPLNYETFISLKNDISASLYTLLDLYLSKKRMWQRRSLPLITEELGFQGKRYQSKRTRHAKLKELVADLDGLELLNGKLALSIEETSDGTDWKLVARKERRIQPKPRLLKAYNDLEKATYLADYVIEEILSQPKAGSPRRDYIIFLCRYYPESLIRDALGLAKADYRGNVRKTLTHVFVGEVKRLVAERKLQWHSRK